jgi:hypothetical protein
MSDDSAYSKKEVDGWMTEIYEEVEGNMLTLAQIIKDHVEAENEDSGYLGELLACMVDTVNDIKEKEFEEVV